MSINQRINAMCEHSTTGQVRLSKEDAAAINLPARQTGSYPIADVKAAIDTVSGAESPQ